MHIINSFQTSYSIFIITLHCIIQCTLDQAKKWKKAKSFGMEISGRNPQDLDKHVSWSRKVTLGKTKLFSVVKNNLLIFMILFIGKFSFQFSANICFIEIYYSSDFIIYREPSSYEGIFIVSSSSNSVISFCFEQRI